MAKTELVIHLAAGAPRIGVWCEGCLTSARYELDVYRLTDTGPRPIKTVRRCRRCDDDD